MTSKILRLELVESEVANEPSLSEHSWILSSASTFHERTGHAFLSPGTEKDASLGVLFEHIAPKDGDCFELELGVVLPDSFPNLDGKSEYILPVINGDAKREICISNTMAFLRFTRDGRPFNALVNRREIPRVLAGEFEFIPSSATVEQVRSFATCRYVITGANAEEAMEKHCEIAIHDMITCLNHCVKTMPFVDKSPGRVYQPAYSSSQFGRFYFFLSGREPGTFAHDWISPHIGRVALNTSNLPPAETKRLLDVLLRTDSVDDIDSLLFSAQSFLDGGVTEYVLLLSVIAAEVATQRYVHRRLRQLGVAGKKLKEYKTDLTYGMMLNVILVSIAPAGRKPGSQLVGDMNRARSMRNTYMHNGHLPHDPAIVVELFQNTKEYIKYLRDIEQETPEQSDFHN